MPAFFNQPDGSNTCCEPCDRSGPCEDCADLDATFECTSYGASSKNMAGWQIYYPDPVNNPENTVTGKDVNKIRYRRITVTGEKEETSGATYYRNTYGAQNGITSGTNGSRYQDLQFVFTTNFDGGDTCPFGYDRADYTVRRHYQFTTSCAGAGSTTYFSAMGYTPTYSDTTYTYFGTSATRAIDISATLTEPDTLFDTFQRNAGTLGTSCTTTLTTMSSSWDAGIWGNTLVSGTGVKATITMTGVSSGSSYDLTITLSVYNTVTTATTEEEDVVTVVADADDTDTYEYHVPAMLQRQYTITAVTIAAA